ncbi:MAG: hypothetical protein IJ190_10080 [Prevotella sp.]|nr:hypothetical protein [Prevotella sp.]
MEFDLKEIEELSGAKAHVYSVVFESEEDSLLEQFVKENAQQYSKEMKKIFAKIKKMADITGCRKNFFKEGEGVWADGVVALNHTGRLRLYGIYFNDTVILFGSGGYKPPHVKSYQEYPPLNTKAQQIKDIAQEIMKLIKSGELRIEEDGTLIKI